MKIVILTYAKDTFEVASINRLTEEAEAKGHEVARVRYTDCSMSIEDGFPKVYLRGEEVTDVDAVIPWIIQGDFNYGIDILRQFEAQGAFVLNGSEAFVNACHKWRSAQLFALHNVPTPNTYRANNYKLMHQIIDELPQEKAVIKIAMGTRGNGVILSNDKDSTKSITGTLGVCRDDHILQEFIEESHGVDIRAYVVNNKVIASIGRHSQDGFRSNLHLGGVAKSITLSEDEAALAVRATTALGLRSGGVDLIRSNRGMLVVEVNTSGEFGIEKATSVNVAEKIIEYVESNVKVKA